MKRLLLLLSVLSSINVFSQSPQVGDQIQGGVVFYIDANNPYEGLVALKTATAGAINPGHNVEWGCSGTIVNAGGTAIGTGASNTVNILRTCSLQT